MRIRRLAGIFTAVFILGGGLHGVPPVRAQSDTAPFASMEIWPWFQDAVTLGRAGAALAWSDTPASGWFNPASLLVFPMGGLELSYTGQWGRHALDPSFQSGYSGGLTFTGLKLAGPGMGLMLFRGYPVKSEFEWTLPASTTLEGVTIPGEQARLKTQWRSLGFSLAMRVAYDFVVGAGLSRDRLSLEGIAVQEGLDGGAGWTLTYQDDAGDWSYWAGALWELSPDVQLAFTYRWSPVVTLPVEVTPRDPTDEPRTADVRFGFPDVLAFGAHMRQGRYHLTVDARRWKTGRINKDPWLELFVPAEQRLRYVNRWDLRFGVSVEFMMNTLPLIFQFGGWSKPLLQPVWNGDPETPHADYFATRWPHTKNRWHATAGFIFRPQRNVQFAVAGVTGPQRKAVIFSLTTIF